MTVMRQGPLHPTIIATKGRELLGDTGRPFKGGRAIRLGFDQVYEINLVAKAIDGTLHRATAIDITGHESEWPDLKPLPAWLGEP